MNKFMTILESIETKKYSDALLMFIYDNLNNVKIKELLKEHKRASESIYKRYNIESYASEINKKNDYQNLYNLINIHFQSYKESTINQLRAYFFIEIYKIAPVDYTRFFNLKKNKHYTDIRRIKEKIKSYDTLENEINIFINSFSLNSRRV